MKLVNDVTIIGAGPAGMSAAIYLKRANIDFHIFEKSMPGGKLNMATAIDNYPGIANVDGFTLAMNFVDQLTKLGVKIEGDDVIKVEKVEEGFNVYTKNHEILSKAIIIATGMNPIKKQIINQDKFLGKGVSYCAVCDGFFFRGKDVLVYGNNKRAYLEALYLADLVNKVYFVHDSNFESCIELTNLLERENVEEFAGYKILEIDGEENVASAKISNLETKEEKVLEVSGVFPLFDETPSNYVFDSLNVETKNNFFIVNDKLETSIPGVYAAGDCVKNQLKQVVTATRDGAVAASNVIAYLRTIKK